MNLSERIADWLVQQGITQVFAVTGGGAMYLNQALGSHPGLQCTYLHHEQACAMAAEGYARIAGKPAPTGITSAFVGAGLPAMRPAWATQHNDCACQG